MLQVWGGGPLDQNCCHPYSKETDRGAPAHAVDFTPAFRGLNEQLDLMITKKDPYQVNSLHHQGVPLVGLAEGFRPIMIGPYDIVEAMIHETLPIAGYQGHPKSLGPFSAN